MNGIALLLISATLGVEYDWQTTDDGQIEYVLIVEPDFIPALAEGSEIRSSVPPELESVQRLCIRIAQPAKGGVAPQPERPRRLPADAFRSSRIGLRAADPMTILWKAAGKPEENLNVKYGWQPTKEGLQEYFVQIDPKLLRTLAPGDEIYTTLSAEAGRTDTFVVFSNARQLPKVPGKPAAAPVAGNLASSGGLNPPPGSNAGFQPAPFNSPNAFSPAPLAPAGTNPSATSGGASFGPPAAPGFNSPSGMSPAPIGTKEPTPYPPPRTLGLNDDPALDPSARVNPATGYAAATPPPTDNVRGYQLDNNRWSNSPPVNSTGLNASSNGGLTPQPSPYRNESAGANPYLNPSPPANDPYQRNNQPPAGNAPYRPSVGYPQDNAAPPRGYEANLPPAQQPPDYRNAPPDNQYASLPSGSTLRPSLRDEMKAGPLSPAAAVAEKPFWPLVLLSFGLFVSIGANFYLGWTAAEFYSRYRLAVERLRTTGPRS